MKDNKAWSKPDINNINPKYWEQFLDKNLFPNDSYNESENNSTLINSILSENSLNQIFLQIETEFNCKVNMNPKNWFLNIENITNGETIWLIRPSEYVDGNIYETEHLFFELNEKYKWLEYWKLLYKLYERIWLENDNFKIFDTEYTNITSMINFYIKEWYEIIWKCVGWMNIVWDFTEDDQDELDRIENEYKNGEQEKLLNFTVMLKKIN